MCGNKMTVVGLPLPMSQERVESAGSQDILAGKDFLSVFLKSSAPRTYNSYRDPDEKLQESYEDFTQLTYRDPTLLETTTDILGPVFEETTIFDSFIRTTRDAQYESFERQPSGSLVTFSTSDSPSSEESVIVAVRVSSSVDRQTSKYNQFQPRTKALFSTSQTISSHIKSSALNKKNNFSSTLSNVPQSLDNIKSEASVIDKHVGDSETAKHKNKSLKDPFSHIDSVGDSTKHVVVSRQQPSLIAHSSKSELNVDETEPITHNRENRNNRDLSNIQPDAGFPATYHQTSNYPTLLHNLPTTVNIPFNLSDFLKSNDKGSQLQPLHHSFIYHDVPQDSARARSVSYSTLIQAVSPAQKKTDQRHEEPENRHNTFNNHQESSQDILNPSYAQPFQNADSKPKETSKLNYFSNQFTSTIAPITISSSTSFHNPKQEISTYSSPVKNSDDIKWSLSYSQQTESSTHTTQISNDRWSPVYDQYTESTTSNNNWASGYSSTQPESSTAANIKNNNWGKFFSLSGTDNNPQKSSPVNPPKIYGRSEQNYEIDEAVSVHTNGRTHGIQAGAENVQQDNKSTEKPTEDPKDKDKKTGYVVEGRNYRRYRVEEKTPDGFIVGEYGVVSNDDGSLRGVRYTADGSINPSVIYNALMKFLSL